jgi:hypothetical protein
MGNVANLALYQKFEDFMDYFEPIVNRFPSYEKNSLYLTHLWEAAPLGLLALS